jgi:hypothetical protein
VAVSKPADAAYFAWGEDLSNNRLYDLERPLRTLSNIAASLNIPVKDLTPHLKQSDRQPVYFSESWHWNKQGHQVVAGVMAEDLIERGF